MIKNLPACWLNKTITVTGKTGKMRGVRVTKEMINPLCKCKTERDAWFCECGGKLKVCNKKPNPKKVRR
jgi:hypothetical protein